MEMNQITETIVTIATAIVGVAILAVLVSRRSNTAGVIQAAASAFGNSLNVAVSPVTGSNISGNLGYPSMLSGGLAL
jgi:predicted permease